MKEIKRDRVYYFVDEAGDPAFYNRNGEFIVGREGYQKNKPSIARWFPTHGTAPTFAIRRLDYKNIL